MKTRKGQAAMEFLMTYGWAILVVIAAIAALAYFGVLNPQNWLPEKCDFPTGQGLTCLGKTVSTTTLIVSLRNNVNGMPIDVTGVTLPASCAAATATMCSGQACNPAANADGVAIDGTLRRVVANELFKVQLSGCVITAGSRYDEDLGLTFISATDGLSHTASGNIKAKV